MGGRLRETENIRPLLRVGFCRLNRFVPVQRSVFHAEGCKRDLADPRFGEQTINAPGKQAYDRFGARLTDRLVLNPKSVTLYKIGPPAFSTWKALRLPIQNRDERCW